MRLDFFTECLRECFGECLREFSWDCWELFLLVLGLAAFVVVFEVMLGCPFLDSRAAGRGRGVVRREIAQFVVNRLAPADFRSVASLAPSRTTPILHRWTLLNERRLSGS